MIALAGLAAAGCGRVRLVAFDRAENTVTLCGNAFARGRDFEAGARRSCGAAGPQLVRCGLEAVGSRTTTSVGGTYSTTAPVNRTCCVYTCG
ncbi:MAG TPA: hypothetical protein VF841_17535 [Anaeromyxobacter sp.]